MDDKFNTAAGWVLFAGIVALGSSIASGMYFHADRPESPEEPGYFIDAPGVTGQLLCVDGGQHLGWQTPDIQGRN